MEAGAAMNLASWIILGIVAVVVALAAYGTVCKARGGGGCCGGCDNGSRGAGEGAAACGSTGGGTCSSCSSCPLVSEGGCRR